MMINNKERLKIEGHAEVMHNFSLTQHNLIKSYPAKPLSCINVESTHIKNTQKGKMKE